MEGNSKTMHLIPYISNKLKTVAIHGQFERFCVAGKKYFLLIFCKPYHCYFSSQAECLDAFDGCTQLSLTTVNDYQLRQRRLLINKAFVSPADYFFHGCEIIN